MLIEWRVVSKVRGKGVLGCEGWDFVFTLCRVVPWLGVSLHGCSSKGQPLLLTLDMGYLLMSSTPDLGPKKSKER